MHTYSITLCNACDAPFVSDGNALCQECRPLNIELTDAGKGLYLPTQGKFLTGQDPRRHKFSFEECSLGGHVAAFTLLTRYGDAYCDSDEEWEALAGSRLDTILRLRAQMQGNHIAG